MAALNVEQLQADIERAHPGFRVSIARAPARNRTTRRGRRQTVVDVVMTIEPLDSIGGAFAGQRTSSDRSAARRSAAFGVSTTRGLFQ